MRRLTVWVGKVFGLLGGVAFLAAVAIEHSDAATKERLVMGAQFLFLWAIFFVVLGLLRED